MRTTREWLTVDAVVAAALAAGCLLEIWWPHVVPGVGDVVGSRPQLTLTSLVATVPLAARRRFPTTVLVLVVGSLALQQLLTTPTQGLVLLLAAMVAAYSSSAFGTPGHALVAGAVMAVGAAVIGEDAGDWAFITVVLGTAWLVGFVVRQRSVDLHRAREDNRELSRHLAMAVRQLEEAQRIPGTSPASAEIASLTPREVDVARGIAQGMSNAEIARDLSISEWTVKTHVAHILRKLALRDRAQVVVAAYESGLVEPARQRPPHRPSSTELASGQATNG